MSIQSLENNLNKEFVTNEQAKELQTLGFNEVCLGYYRHYTDGKKELRFDSSKMRNVEAPTYSQVFRWFRDKYNLYHEIVLDSYKEPYSLKVTIKHLDITNNFVDKEYYPYANGIGDINNKKYEEAEKACLDKLIEIVKNERISSINN